MKKAFLITGALFLACSIQAQDIFKKHGFEKETLTLSKGRYEEVFTNKEVVQIGTVLLNTKTNRVVKFLDEETEDVSFKAEHSSRWLSPDPLAEKYPQLSPYVFCANNPVNNVDLNGDSIWINYQDEEGNQQRMLYAANMNYKGDNTFVSSSVNYLNSVYGNGGSNVMDKLIGSSNNFNMINQTPTDENGNSIDALQFSEAKGGGGDIYAGMLTNSQYSDYSKVEGVAHELFHGFQYENGQGGTSIFNEVEAMVYSSAISNNWANSTGYFGALSANGLGNETANGKIYQQSFSSLLNNGFSLDAFVSAVKAFKTGSVSFVTGDKEQVFIEFL